MSAEKSPTPYDLSAHIRVFSRNSWNGLRLGLILSNFCCFYGIKDPKGLQAGLQQWFSCKQLGQSPNLCSLFAGGLGDTAIQLTSVIRMVFLQHFSPLQFFCTLASSPQSVSWEWEQVQEDHAKKGRETDGKRWVRGGEVSISRKWSWEGARTVRKESQPDQRVCGKDDTARKLMKCF